MKKGLLVLMLVAALATSVRADISAGIGGGASLVDFNIGWQELDAKIPYEIGGWGMWKGKVPDKDDLENRFAYGVYGRMLTKNTAELENPIPVLNEIWPMVSARAFGELRLKLTNDIGVSPGGGLLINDVFQFKYSYANIITEDLENEGREHVFGIFAVIPIGKK